MSAMIVSSTQLNGSQYAVSASTLASFENISLTLPGQHLYLMSWRSADGSVRSRRPPWTTPYMNNDFGSRITNKEDESTSIHDYKAESETVENEPSKTLLWGNEHLYSTYPTHYRPDPPKATLHDSWRHILAFSIPIAIYIAATSSSLALALWWTIAHDDISGGFTMGAYVWGVVVFPTGYWHWIGMRRVADEKDGRELEELEANWTGGIESAEEDPVEVE